MLLSSPFCSLSDVASWMDKKLYYLSCDVLSLWLLLLLFYSSSSIFYLLNLWSMFQLLLQSFIATNPSSSRTILAPPFSWFNTWIIHPQNPNRLYPWITKSTATTVLLYNFGLQTPLQHHLYLLQIMASLKPKFPSSSTINPWETSTTRSIPSLIFLSTIDFQLSINN